MTEAPTAEAVRALLDRGPGSNVAVTAPDADDDFLRPWRLPASVDVVQPTLERIIGTLPRWRVAGRRDGVIWAERRTRLFRFVDDVYVLCREVEGETVVEVRSASRLGRGDLGQNRRNIRELWRGVRGFLEAHHPPLPAGRRDAVT